MKTATVEPDATEFRQLVDSSTYELFDEKKKEANELLFSTKKTKRKAKPNKKKTTTDKNTLPKREEIQTISSTS